MVALPSRDPSPGKGAGLRGDPKGPLFRTVGRGTGKLTRTVLPQASAYRNDRPARCGRRHWNDARQPQLPGDRDHRLSEERRDAGKGRGDGEPCLDAHDTALDRRRDELSLDEVERIVISACP